MENRTRGFEVMKGGETDEGIRVLGINVRSSYFVPANVYRQWRCITVPEWWYKRAPRRRRSSAFGVAGRDSA